MSVCLGEIARLNRLVESLLTVSRAKTLDACPSSSAPSPTTASLRAAPFAASARACACRRRGRARSPSPTRDALAGAVDNLLRNAVEASPRGTTVLVRIGAAEGAAVLDVEDAGPGIPEARRAELFEPFFTTKPEGTGLGLWISRLLLEAKGASLRYERVGDRTRMRIAFSPRAPVVPPPPAAGVPPTLP